MAHEAIKITNQGAYVLKGKITAVSGKEVHLAIFGTVDDMPIPGCCHVDINEQEVKNVPIFYHCEYSQETDKTGGGFSIGDSVIVLNYGSAEILDASNMKIVGFSDGLPKKCSCDLSAKIKIASTQENPYDILRSELSFVRLYIELEDGSFPDLLKLCRGSALTFIRPTTSSPQSGGGYPCFYFYIEDPGVGDDGYFQAYVNGDFSLRSPGIEIEGLERVVWYRTPLTTRQCIKTISVELRCKTGANTGDYITVDTINIRVLSGSYGNYIVCRTPCYRDETGVTLIWYDMYNCLGQYRGYGYINVGGIDGWTVAECTEICSRGTW